MNIRSQGSRTKDVSVISALIKGYLKIKEDGDYLFQYVFIGYNLWLDIGFQSLVSIPGAQFTSYLILEKLLSLSVFSSAGWEKLTYRLFQILNKKCM